MNNAELFHRWAHQVKPKGKSGNVFYEGPILYSYGHHFPLAVLTDKIHDGKQVCLVNARSYSTTTVRHKSYAVRASSHIFHIHVPRPDNPTDPKNLERLNSETAHAIERLKHVRTGIDYREADARRCEQTAKIYRRVFLKGRGHVHALPKDFAEILVKARERGTRHDAAQAAEQERRVVERARQRELNALADAEKIVAWRAGESVSLPWNLPCMLRLKGETVQTSLGAEIPLSHARRAYGAVLNAMQSGVDFESNGHTIPVGVYKVDKIEANGTLHAGCHHITFEETARFAAAMGW